MTSISKLLNRRNTTLLGKSGCKSLALSRSHVSRYIGENYREYNDLRGYFEYGKPLVINDKAQHILDYLINNNLVEKINNKYQYYDNDARNFLSGGWLEELIYCAILETSPDEVLYQQKVEWEVNGVIGKNEIDVIARKGNVLSFISCKACNWNYRNNKQSDRNKLRDFVFEVDYWDTHFSDNNGRAVLAITQDLIDEENDNKKRCSTIFARAEIMNVDLISLDYFEWGTLVHMLQKHWD